jgi:hypothetical protein
MELDNNLVAKSIVGRKNYLFDRSHESAQRGVVVYTRLAACKSASINPTFTSPMYYDNYPTKRQTTWIPSCPINAQRRKIKGGYDLGLLGGL